MNRTHWIVAGALALGLVLALVGGMRFAVKPVRSRIEDQLAVKQDLEAKLQKARDTAAQFDKFKAQAENVRRDLDFYSARIDEPLTSVGVQKMLQTIENQYNFRECTYDIKALTSDGSVTTYEVDIKFKSDFEHLGLFLDSCLGQKRLVVLDGFTLTELDDTDGAYVDTMKVELKLLVYGGDSKKGKS
jgi:Tfp pilus assembly protein PilO